MLMQEDAPPQCRGRPWHALTKKSSNRDVHWAYLIAGIAGRDLFAIGEKSFSSETHDDKREEET